MDLLKSVIHPIHREGYIFIAIFAIASMVMGVIWEPAGWIGAIATVWCIFFFRDPDRHTPQDEHLVISPADGLVQSIVPGSTPPPELELKDGEYTRISIFLNIFNVHVNRIPIAGKIEKLHYHPGKFLNASLDKASDENERQSVLIKTKDDQLVGCVQIAGLIARRIVCYLKDDQEVETGERFGIIRFGSRTDIYLPKGIAPLVAEGQLAIGGETIIANLKDKKTKRTAKKI